jgi:hypothetical protein
MNTLLLSTDNWDLTVDNSGNIAIAQGPYAIAQDVASAVRTFLGECWYDTTQGVPYLEQILGQLPSLQFMKAKFIAAGLTVPGVASIACFLTGPGSNRELGGQLQITDTDGNFVVIQTTNLQGIAPWYVNAATDGAQNP